MLTRGIHEFVSRDWPAVRRSKDSYWAERIGRLGPFEGLRIGEELRQQALARDPSWPDVARRREDLDVHVRLAALFRRAYPASRR